MTLYSEGIMLDRSRLQMLKNLSNSVIVNVWLFGCNIHREIVIQNLQNFQVAKALISSFIIQVCFVEYKYRAKRVQISHDICTRLIPPGRVKFKTLASQNFGKRNRWIINLLLDVLVCSIAVYFYSLFVF